MSSQFTVITAVEKLNYRVTVGDVSVQSGLALNLAQTELLNLATRTSANLQVSDTGEIVYVFSPQIRQILRDRDFKLQVRAWLAQIWQWVFYLIRISFGILLIASMAIVVIAIVLAFIALQSANSNNNSDRNDDRGGSFGFMPNFFWFDLGNVFAPNYSQTASQTGSKSNELDSQPKLNFLESIFSFLFGDGNPNFDLEERRYREISEVIRNNGGVAIAEQITPYLDVVSDKFENFEDYMIPVLSKLNGLPQVTEIGTLAYTFPELQKVASARTEPSRLDKLGGYFQENLWKFSKVGTGKISLAIALGVFYLVSALFLGNLLGQLSSIQLSGFLGFVAGAYGLLLGYATLFLAIPTVRYFVLQILNNKIKDKNLKRANRARILAASNPNLKQKLELARQFTIAQEVIGAENLAYTTETDLNDQEYAKMLKQNRDKLS